MKMKLRPQNRRLRQKTVEVYYVNRVSTFKNANCIESCSK